MSTGRPWRSLDELRSLHDPHGLNDPSRAAGHPDPAPRLDALPPTGAYLAPHRSLQAGTRPRSERRTP